MNLIHRLAPVLSPLSPVCTLLIPEHLAVRANALLSWCSDMRAALKKERHTERKTTLFLMLITAIKGDLLSHTVLTEELRSKALSRDAGFNSRFNKDRVSKKKRCGKSL